MMHRLIRSSLIIAGLCVTLGACDQPVEEEMSLSEIPTMVTNVQEPIDIYIESLWDNAPTQIGTEIDSGALTIGGSALPVASPTSDPSQVSGAAKTPRRQHSPLIKTGIAESPSDATANCQGTTCAPSATSAMQDEVDNMQSPPMHDPSDAPCMDEGCDGSAGLA